jgi:hypothetical protein
MKGINIESVYAKILALSIIYEKEEGCRRVFLERISYTGNEMKVVMETVSDFEFRNWIEKSIPVMNCREGRCSM